MKLCLACHHSFDTVDWECPYCGHSPEVHDGYVSFSPDLARTSDGFKADYFPRLALFEAANFWFRSRNRLLVWALRSFFPNTRSLLEIGCGTGFVLAGFRQAFPELKLCGSEAFTSGLAFAEHRLPGITLLQMDVRQIPYGEEFDVIGSFDVLEHVEEDETALLQMFCATRIGGGILLTVPQHPFLWSAADDYSFHKRRYTRHELVSKVERAGFKIVRVTSFVSLLLPLMILSRLKQRGIDSRFNPLTELKVRPVLSWMLEKALSVERAAIERGISFPMGGSLLVVAVKEKG
jgi:SAM-dependent methyltransferase